ncbi:MAG: hypothetical protein WD607_02480 [Candidatus Paceibacterota bacterium]
MTLDLGQRGIILDACCIINLYASSVMEEVMESISIPFYVDQYVREKEALKIKADNENEFADIDLAPFIQKGLLKEISLIQEESNLFVNLAVTLDDGEARCGAIASHRKFIVATDEKVGIRIFSGLNTPIPTITTLEMLYHWSVSKNIRPVKINAILKNIEKRANYRPGSNHAYFSWWEENYLIR